MLPKRQRRVASAFAVLALVGLTSCARPTPCQSLPDCDEGYECLAFRCVPPGGNPVPPSSERELLLPEAIAAEGEEELGGSVDLGAPVHGSLYVDFVLPESDCERLDSAFLLLETGEREQPLPASVEVRVRRVREDWTPRSVGDGHTPDDGIPEARGWVLPRRTARIDVTAVVCNLLDSAEPSHGMVVRSATVDVPLRIATGTDSALPPRLELYLRPEKKSEAAAKPER